jgi:hypothetical protein
MRRLKTITTIIAAAGLLGLAAPALADGPCDRGPMTFKLKVKVQQNKPVGVTYRGSDAENLRVCPNDMVEWKLINPASAGELFIDFKNSAPFSGNKMRRANNGKVLVTISGPDVRPGASFKYDIGITNGGVWDPRIIIEES